MNSNENTKFNNVNRNKFNYVEGKISHTNIFPPMIREGRNTDGKLNFQNLLSKD